MSRARRRAATVSLALFDADDFKSVNDRFGHAGGDAVLQAIATRGASALRACDLFGRWGGDEFMAIFPETALSDAVMLTERIRAAVSHEPIALPQGGSTGLTLSAGVVSTADLVRPGLDDLIAEADRLLFASKRAGRDRIAHPLPAPTGSPATEGESAARAANAA